MNNIGNSLYLGNNSADSGMYNLGGNGQLSVSGTEYVGTRGGYACENRRHQLFELHSFNRQQRRQHRLVQPQWDRANHRRPGIRGLFRLGNFRANRGNE